LGHCSFAFADANFRVAAKRSEGSERCELNGKSGGGFLNELILA
jgi:hypothetical protein